MVTNASPELDARRHALEILAGLMVGAPA
jgi:hypothetical protein